MLNIIILLQDNTESLSRLISILSIASITFFALLCWSLFKVQKLEKQISQLKSQNKS